MTRSMQPSSEYRSQHNAGTNSGVLCIAVVPKGGFALQADVVSFPLYWVQAELPSFENVAEFLGETEFGMSLKEVLSDNLIEELWCAGPNERSAWTDKWQKCGYSLFAERQFLPGVTDNLSRTVEEALHMKALIVRVASGKGFLFKGNAAKSTPADLIEAGKYVYYHPLSDKFVVHSLEDSDRESRFLSFPTVHLPEPQPPAVINLDLDDRGLMQLSQERLLALNLAEMKAIRGYFLDGQSRIVRGARGLPNWPTDVELEVIAQTWSEHCKHKIFGATIEHVDTTRGEMQKFMIRSLYKTYIQKPTFDLMQRRQDLLSVFEDNSGIVSWNNEWAVCFKVETHNSPSALEPYGGALTGILGVNRDVLGTGLGARPIFNTDIFCFAYPSDKLPQRPKLLPAKTILDGVRRGVQDGGNKSGIPTVNGAIFFDDMYRGKPLVFCGTGGILPTMVHKKSGFKKYTSIGDTIVTVGGRVGKDGIHGATFSSEALHEGSPVSAVQIGDPFTQKRVVDFIIEARDRGMISGITDNGAGGLSSSVGEMARITNGATLELDNIPLKYPGLSDYEIVISESQERMTVSTKSFPELKRLAERYNVEATSVGSFHTKGYFEITRKGKPVGLLDLEFLHNGCPTLQLQSEWSPPKFEERIGPVPENLGQALLSLLAQPNICSREAVIRQYDHEVQAGSVIKPLMGPHQQAPCDGAVFRPLYEEEAGLVVSNGICPALSKYDTYVMAVGAVDEAVRNAVCVGADPATIVLLDNFCWPDPIPSERNPDGKYKLAQLVRACEGMADTIFAYGTPLISGKDSMKNDFDDGTIRLSVPPTLLISAMGRIHNSDSAVSMDFKSCGDLIYLLCAGGLAMGGTQYTAMNEWESTMVPKIDLKRAADMYKQLHQSIVRGWVKSCHDISDGGVAVSIAESVIGSGLGAEVKMAALREAAQAYSPSHVGELGAQLLGRDDFVLFAEGPARLVITIQPELRQEWESLWTGYSCTLIGEVVQTEAMIVKSPDGSDLVNVGCHDLTAAWKTPLPFD
jgi:phosphoribosylformylglycinamidine synthase subunit PurSL